MAIARGKGRLSVAHAGCGCGVVSEGGRLAVAVDPEAKARISTGSAHRRPGAGSAANGRRRPLLRRHPPQLSSAQEALRAVGRELMRNHLRHCATQAIRTGGADAEGMYDELVELVERFA